MEGVSWEACHGRRGRRVMGGVSWEACHGRRVMGGVSWEAIRVDTIFVRLD